MLDLINNGTPVPKKMVGVSGKKFWRKVALGLLLWNNVRGEACDTYMITQERTLKNETGESHTITVVRFPGGSMVPPPFAVESDMEQSLVRIQQFFGDDVTVTREVGLDWIPLHELWVSSVKIYNTPGNIGTYAPSQGALVDYGGGVSHKVMDSEVHGVLPTSQAFIDYFRPKLERVWLNEDGRVQTESGRPFNNIGIPMILRHMLAVLQTPGPADFDTLIDYKISEVDPTWENDDYQPYHDV